MRRQILSVLMVAAVLANLVGEGKAAFQTFTTLAAFSAATSSLPINSIINFDSTAIPTVIGNGSTFQNITFSHGQDFLGTNLVVSDGTNTGTFVGPQLPTTSGTRFLGNTGNSQLVAGRYNFTMQFNPTSQVVAVGMFLVASGAAGATGITNGDIRLVGNSGATSAQVDVAAVQQTLNQGQANESQVFFLGMYNDAGLLGDVSVNTFGPTDAFRFRIDDIRVAAVPEPSSLVTIGFLGATAAIRTFRRRRNLRVG